MPACPRTWCCRTVLLSCRCPARMPPVCVWWGPAAAPAWLMTHQDHPGLGLCVGGGGEGAHTQQTADSRQQRQQSTADRRQGHQHHQQTGDCLQQQYTHASRVTTLQDWTPPPKGPSQQQPPGHTHPPSTTCSTTTLGPGVRASGPPTTPASPAAPARPALYTQGSTDTPRDTASACAPGTSALRGRVRVQGLRAAGDQRVARGAPDLCVWAGGGGGVARGGWRGGGDVSSRAAGQAGQQEGVYRERERGGGRVNGATLASKKNIRGMQRNRLTLAAVATGCLVLASLPPLPEPPSSTPLLTCRVSRRVWCRPLLLQPTAGRSPAADPCWHSHDHLHDTA